MLPRKVSCILKVFFWRKGWLNALRPDPEGAKTLSGGETFYVSLCLALGHRLVGAEPVAVTVAAGTVLVVDGGWTAR